MLPPSETCPVKQYYIVIRSFASVARWPRYVRLAFGIRPISRVVEEFVCAIGRRDAAVPVRQLMVRHLALASMSSAGIDRMSGTCRWRGRPRLANGQIIRTSAGKNL